MKGHDCDTISYPYANIGAVNTLHAGDFFGLAVSLAEVEATIVDLIEAANISIASCGRWPGTPYNIYQEKML